MAKVTLKVTGSSATTTVEDVATVGDALRAAGQDSASYSLTLNGVNTTQDARLANGDILLLVPKVKGGASMVVRVIRTGGQPVTVTVDPSATVSDAVTASGIDSSGCTTRLNGLDSNGGDSLREGDTIMLVAKVHGGN